MSDTGEDYPEDLELAEAGLADWLEGIEREEREADELP